MENPHGLVVTPDGEYLIAGSLKETLLKEGEPEDTRDGRYAYVSNCASGNISEIDIGTWTVKPGLQSGASPEHLTFSADESLIYVANPRISKV